MHKGFIQHCHSEEFIPICIYVYFVIVSVKNWFNNYKIHISNLVKCLWAQVRFPYWLHFVRIWPVQYELIVTPHNSMYGDLHLDCNPTPSSSLLWSAPVQPTRETYSQHRVKMGPSPQSTQSSPGSRHHGSYTDHRPNCSCSSTGWGKHAKWRGRNEETTRKRG